MPSKKKKYNARFPASRIKKIMQTDEEVGKVAQAVPVIISKALEMFIESLLKKSSYITQNRNAKTLTPSHMKQCILSESRFDFLKDLVKNIPDASIQEDNENNALADSNVNFGIIPDDIGALPVEARLPPPKERRKDNSQAEQSSSSGSRTPGVIQFVPKQENPKFNFTVNSLIGHQEETEMKDKIEETERQVKKEGIPFVPSLVPLSTDSSSTCGQSSSILTGDNLCIDEDYDN